MSEHAPGPLDLIDELWPHSKDILEAQYPAEARLIAAAPKMLAALKRYVHAMEQRSYPELQGITSDAFAAIAEVEGEA